MKSAIVRLDMPQGPNLYRLDGKHPNGWPIISAFEKDPDARKLLGRWSPCPNINVRMRMMRTIGMEIKS